MLASWNKAITNLDIILKSRDITLLTKVPVVKAMVFPVVMYGCESWTIKKTECWRTDVFKLWSWRRLLRISLLSKDSQESSPAPQFESINSLALSQLSHPYVTTGETTILTIWIFVGKMMSLLFNMICHSFRSKEQALTSWRKSPSAVILEPKKIKSVTVSIFPHLLVMKLWDWMLWS